MATHFVLVAEKFFQLIAWTWLIPLLLKSVTAQPSICQQLDPSPNLQMFVDKLPIPATIDISTGAQLTLGIYKITQKLHRDLPNTTLYAYGTSQATASSPGPTLRAKRGIISHVRWENHISDPFHFLPVDSSIHWANPKSGGVPIVTHLHGAEVESASDGHPDTWFTEKGETGPKFVTQNYTYANSQPPTMLWYHDHVVGITRLNVYAGLAGVYFINSPSEDAYNLPSGDFEIPLVIQDKQFYANGSLNFPNVGDSPLIHPIWCPEFFGDTILVNGKIWPYLNVQPRLYRFRILNAANARFFTLSFNNSKLSFDQIGTDGGFLYKPIVLSTLTVAPAFRVDVLVDFSSLAPGTDVLLTNSAPAPFPSGSPALSPNGTHVVMKFHVISADSYTPGASSSIPSTFPPYAAINLTNVTVTRNLTLQEFDDSNGNPIVSLLGNLTWVDPVTETPLVGSTEIWQIINLTPDAHPIHVHLIQFHVLNQQSFDETGFLNGSCNLSKNFPKPGSCFTEKPRGPTVDQIGWKDTAITWPGNVTRFLIKFTPQDGSSFPFDVTAGPGFVWHCHILDHEDNDMMRPYVLH
ncbi:hypothetical protein O6H91_04G062000 [Diphasiastrum complanatum]|uniref:Uncharacterized protein n=2 Tax=Diphasiastrum complanatum TaxID=34168 RepID=A0ACC2DXH7_DIPCM|nr:hypothetical protein O6H91_04G062000 [Diphasiastrum complanatum]KAJ7558935.1 hypothetical protein O6H91_04G062000 [Diphasiastrum complanatum]